MFCADALHFQQIIFTMTSFRFLSALLLVVVAPSCSAWAPLWLSKSIAVAVLSSLSLNDDPDELMRSLKAPTDDTPQIVMPSRQADGSKNTNDANAPLVQGLVYMSNPRQERPDISDVLILTVRDVDKETVLAGAKIPVSRLRLPLSFSMYDKNVLPGQILNGQTGDLIVNAKICPSTTLCSEEEASFQATGIAKVITNLPGLDDGTTMRAAASLGLK